MREPMVSIIIPVYNGANYLESAISSALSQTYPYCEVLVVNDGSTDGGATERIAQSFGNRIRYFSKENGGVASAVNYGIQQMHGQYFSWLSHDDYYRPEKIMHQLAAIPPEQPDTLVYSNYELVDEFIGAKLQTRYENYFSQRQLTTPLLPVMFRMIHGSATLIHRSHFERIGLFDERQLTTQDYDMWFRAFRNAYICFDPHCDVIVRLHAEAGNLANPNFASNASVFWIHIDRLLTDAERAQISGTPRCYYKQMTELLARTRYEDAKHYFEKKANQKEEFREGLAKEEKYELLRILSTNCGVDMPAACEDDELNMLIKQMICLYGYIPGNRQMKHIRTAKWSIGVRLKRAIKRYGWIGMVKKMLSKIGCQR